MDRRNNYPRRPNIRSAARPSYDGRPLPAEVYYRRRRLAALFALLVVIGVVATLLFIRSNHESATVAVTEPIASTPRATGGAPQPPLVALKLLPFLVVGLAPSRPRGGHGGRHHTRHGPPAPAPAGQVAQVVRAGRNPSHIPPPQAMTPKPTTPRMTTPSRRPRRPKKPATFPTSRLKPPPTTSATRKANSPTSTLEGRPTPPRADCSHRPHRQCDPV